MSVILGIECTCDDTGVGLVVDGKLVDEIKLTSWDYHSSRPDIDKAYASIMHKKNIPIAVETVLTRNNLRLADVDYVGVSTEPGMMSSVYQGMRYALSAFETSATRNKIIPVHHLEAHLLVVRAFYSDVEFPFYCLVLSGVHTQLFYVKRYRHYELVEEQKGMGLGNALDLVARKLGLDIKTHGSGGRAIEANTIYPFCKNASTEPKQINDWSEIMNFDEVDGIECTYFHHILGLLKRNIKYQPAPEVSSEPEPSSEVQESKKKEHPMAQQKTKLVICGGVSANQHIRLFLQENNIDVFAPPMENCVDNGGMIAWSVYEMLRHRLNPSKELVLRHRSKIEDLKMSSNRYISVEQAADLIINKKVVAFPTETVYGLGARADSDEAVNLIYTSKGRHFNNPLIIHIASLEQLEQLVPNYKTLGDKVQKWIAEWPAPLTLILPYDYVSAPYKVCKMINKNYPNTVAVRMPDNPIALSLIQKAGPIAAPSANTSGKPSPTTAEHVWNDLGERVYGIVDSSEHCQYGIESTIIDLTTSNKATVLRPGSFVWCQSTDSKGDCENKDNEKPKAPGMKYKHYKPDVPLRLIRSIDEVSAAKQRGLRVGFIHWTAHELTPEICNSVRAMYFVAENSDSQMLQRYLYAALWTLNDTANLDVLMINVDGLDNEGVLDKLNKASE
ncbi:unnamed protein product [Adineta steineri]|uniref:Threonylcarbamoyl-AMP synthase n=1 Tax=Adineta steineri TaxID=433720 RepID=A0A815VHH3_9BILA|nr:unnamed protein product [Adineta steineri]CAF1528997.1 unnamed protein product [Adineta steineri]